MIVREGKIPEGKGIFVHVISSAWAGSMASLADYLRDNGYAWVAPKMQDGSLAFNSGDQQSLLEQLVVELERVGIDLVGWGYVYGETNLYRTLNNWCDKEIAITIQMIGKFRPVAWIVDAESAYEGASNGANSAKKYMDGILDEMAITNDAVPDIPVGFSSYKFPNSHNLPWLEFLSRSDFAAPQVYWWGRTQPGDSVEELVKSVAQYKANGAENLPFVPAGTFRDDNATWWATVDQVQLFNQACYQSEDIIGMNYWDLRFLQQRDTLENALNSFGWEVDAVDPEQPEDCDCETILAKFAELMDKLEEIQATLDAMNGDETPTDPEDPEEPTEPPSTDIYLHLKYIYDNSLPNAKDFTPAYRLYRVDNGKYKTDKIDNDNVVVGDVVKLLTTPVRGTYLDEDGVGRTGWWILADGFDIAKNMFLAANLEGGIPSDVDKSQLMYIETTLNDKLQKCIVLFDATKNIWRNPDTHEDWTLRSKN